MNKKVYDNRGVKYTSLLKLDKNKSNVDIRNVIFGLDLFLFAYLSL